MAAPRISPAWRSCPGGYVLSRGGEIVASIGERRDDGRLGIGWDAMVYHTDREPICLYAATPMAAKRAVAEEFARPTSPLLAEAA